MFKTIQTTKASRVIRNLTRKKTFFITTNREVLLSNGYWSGGSRSEYFMIDLVSGVKTPLSYPKSPSEFGGGEAPLMIVPFGKAIIECGVSSGKPAFITVNVNPCDIPLVFGMTKFEHNTPEEIVSDWMTEKLGGV